MWDADTEARSPFNLLTASCSWSSRHLWMSHSGGFLSSGNSCGGPDPDRDVLRRAELVHGQHPAADLKPRCEGSDGGTVQRVAEAPAESKHPGTLEPHRPLNQGPGPDTDSAYCTLPQTAGNPDWREGAAVHKLNI